MEDRNFDLLTDQIIFLGANGRFKMDKKCHLCFRLGIILKLYFELTVSFNSEYLVADDMPETIRTKVVIFAFKQVPMPRRFVTINFVVAENVT